MKFEVKEDSSKRLKRIAGQVTGIQKMVDDERDCADILQQVVAVRAALDQLGVNLLTQHLQTCILQVDVKKNEDCCHKVPEDQWSEEIRATLTRFLK